MRISFSNRRYPLFVLLLVVFSFAQTGWCEEPIKRLVVFGDSLSDTGLASRFAGVPPESSDGFPYFAGRFSNGPIWIDFLQESLSLTDDDVRSFAVGGAQTGFGLSPVPAGTFDVPDRVRIPTVGAQIRAFLFLDEPQPGDLVLLWAGANNIFTGRSPIRAAANIESHIRSLVEAGSREFLVPNLPLLGETPAANSSFFLRLGANSLTVEFNNELERRLRRLETQLDIKIHRMDVETLSEFAIEMPGLFGFTNVRNAALDDILAERITREQGANYVYWDSVHPTSKSHEAIARFAFRILTAED